MPVQSYLNGPDSPVHFFFFKLRSNSHNMKLSIVRCVMQWHLIHLDPKIFYHPKGKHVPISGHTLSLPPFSL